MPKRKASPRVNIRVPPSLRSQLDKLAALEHRNLSDYLRLKLEEIAKQEAIAASHE